MMDTLWMWIVKGVWWIKTGLDTLVQPINAVHPALTIVLLAGLTVWGTSVLRRHLVTRRYRRLEAEFKVWHAVRETALESFDDPSRGRRMAKNIDQAELNKVYYDYFFEGLLNNLMNTYLPILFVAAYVNEAFKPDRLREMIGQEAFVTLSEGAQIGALPLFVGCLIAFWIVKPLLTRAISRCRGDSGPANGGWAEDSKAAP